MLYNVSSYCYYHSFVVAIQVCHSLLSDLFYHISFAFCNSTLEQNLEVNHVISSSYRIQRKEKKETCVYTFFLFLFCTQRYFVLEKGMLTYGKSPAEVKVTCVRYRVQTIIYRQVLHIALMLLSIVVRTGVICNLYGLCYITLLHRKIYFTVSWIFKLNLSTICCVTGMQYNLYILYIYILYIHYNIYYTLYLLPNLRKLYHRFSHDGNVFRCLQNKHFWFTLGTDLCSVFLL